MTRIREFCDEMETLVEGNEIGVKETWDGGVEAQPLQPKTYVLFPGFTQKVFIYDMSSQVFVMNDQANETFGEGRRRGQSPEPRPASDRRRPTG